MAPFLLANFLATLYFAIYIFGGLRLPDRYGAKYNVARKLAKRNGAIIYAKAEFTAALGPWAQAPPKLFLEKSAEASGLRAQRPDHKPSILLSF